jgi:hypothetical protein
MLLTNKPGNIHGLPVQSTEQEFPEAPFDKFKAYIILMLIGI